LIVAAGERQRARITHDEHELGEWTRARRAPDARLSGLLERELLGYEHRRAQFRQHGTLTTRTRGTP
jgi:hypothetical protein